MTWLLLRDNALTYSVFLVIFHSTHPRYTSSKYNYNNFMELRYINETITNKNQESKGIYREKYYFRYTAFKRRFDFKYAPYLSGLNDLTIDVNLNFSIGNTCFKKVWKETILWYFPEQSNLISNLSQNVLICYNGSTLLKTYSINQEVNYYWKLLQKIQWFIHDKPTYK